MNRISTWNEWRDVDKVHSKSEGVFINYTEASEGVFENTLEASEAQGLYIFSGLYIVSASATSER